MDKTDNEILARFMDLDIDGDKVTDGDQETTLSDLKYSTSWDWLMPVWYKFRDLQSGTLSLRDFATYKSYWHDLANDISRKPIEQVFQLIVEAVKWYNSLKKSS